MCPDCDYDLVVNTWHVCKVAGKGSYGTWNVIFRSSEYKHYLGVPMELSTEDGAREFLYNHLKDGVGAFLKSPVDKDSPV